MNEFEIISDKYKIERKVNYNIVYNNLVNSIINMFEFKGFPESVRPDMLMRYLWCNGAAAIPLDIDDPPVCICSLGGDVDAYGYGTEVNYNAQNGKISGKGKIGENVALFKNNTYMYPEFYILQTAKLLCEVRTSLNANIINSRLAPLGKARNDAEKAELEKAFDDIYKGKPHVVNLQRNPFDTVTSETGRDGELTEGLTKVSDSAYIPYLSQVEDDIIQKFYYHYGLNLKDVNKRSQVTSEELQGADALVWTVPLMHLQELKKGCEMMRKKYPDADVTFGGVWADEYKKFKAESEEKENENTNVGDNSENPVDERNNDTSGESEELRTGDSAGAGE